MLANHQSIDNGLALEDLHERRHLEEVKVQEYHLRVSVQGCPVNHVHQSSLHLVEVLLVHVGQVEVERVLLLVVWILGFLIHCLEVRLHILLRKALSLE